MNSTMNCPFYGHHFVQVGRPFLLLATGGNQCAIVTESYAPCALAIEDLPVEWSACRRVMEIRHSLRQQPGETVEL